MREGLAPAVAGGRHAHQPRVQPVLQEALQYAVLDQHVAGGGRALVIDGERAAPVLEPAVVHHGHARRRHALADEAGKGARALAVEIALEPVADRLVQQHARPAGAEHDGHLAGGRGHRVDLDQRLAERLVHLRLPGGFLQEFPEADPPAASMRAGLHPPVRGLHGDLHPHHHQRADVRGRLAARALDAHRLPASRKRGRDLHDARVGGAGIGVDSRQQRRLPGEVRRVQRVLRAVEPPVGRRRRQRQRAAPPGGDRAHRLGRAAERRLVEARGMGVAGRLARDRAQPEALADVVGGAGEPAVIQGQPLRDRVLQVKLAVVRAPERVVENAFGGGAVEAGAPEEDGLRLLERGRAGKGGRHGGGRSSGGVAAGGKTGDSTAARENLGQRVA